jgi:hypothetical protein
VKDNWQCILRKLHEVCKKALVPLNGNFTKISIDTLNTNEIRLQPSSLLDRIPKNRIPKRLAFTKGSLCGGQTHLLENTAVRSPAITSNWVPNSSQNCIANPYTDTYAKVLSLWAAEYIGIITFLLTNYI